MLNRLVSNHSILSLRRSDGQHTLSFLSSLGLNMDIQTRVLLEGNLANEVSLIVLDTIELFCGHFKVSERRNVSHIWGLKNGKPLSHYIFLTLPLLYC